MLERKSHVYALCSAWAVLPEHVVTLPGVYELWIGQDLVHAGLEICIRFTGEITVVVVQIACRVTQLTAAIVVAAVGLVKGEDVIFDDIVLALTTKIEDANAVECADVVEDLVFAASQEDAAGFIVNAEVPGDYLSFRSAVRVDAIARIVEYNVAVNGQVVCRAIDAMVELAGTIPKDDISLL